MNKKTYNILKNISLIVLPAMTTMYITIASIWNLPHIEEIAGTLTAIDTFLGSLLQISKYYKNKGEQNNE